MISRHYWLWLSLWLIFGLPPAIVCVVAGIETYEIRYLISGIGLFVNCSVFACRPHALFKSAPEYQELKRYRVLEVAALIFIMVGGVLSFNKLTKHVVAPSSNKTVHRTIHSAVLSGEVQFS